MIFAEFGSFKDATGWQRTKYEFLLYRLVEGALGEPSFDLKAWPAATAVKAFRLRDEAWPSVVTLFQFTTPNFPDAIHAVLTSALAAASAPERVRACWLMFEGGFMDVRALFGDPQQVYGIGTPCATPTLALTPEERTSIDWRCTNRELARAFYSVFRNVDGGSS